MGKKQLTGSTRSATMTLGNLLVLNCRSLTEQEHLDGARPLCAYLLNKLIYNLIVSKQFHHILNVVSRAKAEHSTCLMTDLEPRYKESRNGVRKNAALRAQPSGKHLRRPSCKRVCGEGGWEQRQQILKKLMACERKPKYFLRTHYSTKLIMFSQRRTLLMYSKSPPCTSCIGCAVVANSRA